MNNKKPRDPLYPKGFEEAQRIKQEYPKPQKKDDELTPLEKLNRKIGVYLNPSSIDITDDEKKRKIGVIISSYMNLLKRNYLLQGPQS